MPRSFESTKIYKMLLQFEKIFAGEHEDILMKCFLRITKKIILLHPLSILSSGIFHGSVVQFG